MGRRDNSKINLVTGDLRFINKKTNDRKLLKKQASIIGSFYHFIEKNDGAFCYRSRIPLRLSAGFP